MNDERMLGLGRAVLELEAESVAALAGRLGPTFTTACHLLLGCRGRIVVTGMGKSGHIASKIAATLASTGSPAFFVHPGEASHGDLGMITRDDVVLALSNSGETAELLTILPLIKRLGVPLVALTGRPDSTLAQAAEANLDVSVAKEACPLGLAPTSSTTAALAMGDALAVALLETRGFTSDDFARSHPSGALGRRLLLRVEDLMHTGDGMPRVAPGTPLPQALVEMTRKGLGMTVIADDDGSVAGIFTDGDLRRALDRDIDLRQVTVDEVMSRKPRSIVSNALAAEALESMQSNRINALLVVDTAGRLCGIVSMHDLLRAGVV